MYSDILETIHKFLVKAFSIEKQKIVHKCSYSVIQHQETNS